VAHREGQEAASPALSPEPAAEELGPLAERLRAAAAERHLTVATAESCTGGLVGHAITAVGGASSYYLGGVVSYADAVKTDLLGVSPETLERHGAVSAQVALAMADGVRARLGADVAVAVTGVAGPAGGTPAKPVGLTFIAVADERGHDVRRHHWSGDRDANKRASAWAALDLLLARIEAPPEPAT
jgi:PncC family amidohydrolase